MWLFLLLEHSRKMPEVLRKHLHVECGVARLCVKHAVADKDTHVTHTHTHTHTVMQERDGE